MCRVTKWPSYPRRFFSRPVVIYFGWTEWEEFQSLCQRKSGLLGEQSFCSQWYLACASYCSIYLSRNEMKWRKVCDVALDVGINAGHMHQLERSLLFIWEVKKAQIYCMLEVRSEAHFHWMYIHHMHIHFSRVLTALYNENISYSYTSSTLLLYKKQHAFKTKAKSLRFIANTQMLLRILGYVV